MCGISGIAERDPHVLPDVELALRMRDAIAARGPDDAGLLREPGVALGSRRLAILDLSPRGHMPMATPDGRWAITYNGEIYNYRELREELAAQGERFVSDSDSEVLLRLWSLEGAACLERLNGMFAFAVWDRKERSLALVRDRLGVKPLVWAEKDGRLFFASEPKALFSAGISREPEDAALAELLCFRFVAGEATPFRCVRRLRPGHLLTWKEGRATIRRWWNLAERARERRQSGDAAEWFARTFDDAVRKRRISDVPLGVLLSGGLDSSSVAASIAAQGHEGLASFTVRFPDAGYDEGPLALALARRWGFDAHERTVTDAELPELLRRATRANDEPLAHGNDPHLLALSLIAKPRVTVLLSGEGGDETLSGYVRYRPLRWPGVTAATGLAAGALASVPGVPARLRKLSRMAALGDSGRWVLFNACDTLPADLREILPERPSVSFPHREAILEEARGVYPGEPLRQVLYSDQHTFLVSILDRNDRMTMEASIECRVPFLDYRLVEGLAGLPTRELLRGRGGKPLLRRALGSRLPEEILAHRKWGFGVPWRRLLRDGELRRQVARLPDGELVRRGAVRKEGVRALASRFLAGDDSRLSLLRQLLFVEIWLECVALAAPAPAPAAISRA
jgi:asparagine synthase (glutamine-hydrolysing)